jgi:hypothetical protein
MSRDLGKNVPKLRRLARRTIGYVGSRENSAEKPADDQPLQSRMTLRHARGLSPIRRVNTRAKWL